MSGIAKSFNCTKDTHFRKHILVISYNLIFFDGFHQAKAPISSFFRKSPATVHHRQTYRTFVFSCRKPLPFPGCFRCNCNRPPPLLHFAIFSTVSFIIFTSEPKMDISKVYLCISGAFRQEILQSARSLRKISFLSLQTHSAWAIIGASHRSKHIRLSQPPIHYIKENFHVSL